MSDLIRSITDRLYLSLMRRHGPDDVIGDGTWAACLRCREEWPCAEWLRLDDRREDRP